MVSDNSGMEALHCREGNLRRVARQMLFLDLGGAFFRGCEPTTLGVLCASKGKRPTAVFFPLMWGAACSFNSKCHLLPFPSIHDMGSSLSFLPLYVAFLIPSTKMGFVAFLQTNKQKKRLPHFLNQKLLPASFLQPSFQPWYVMWLTSQTPGGNQPYYLSPSI